MVADRMKRRYFHNLRLRSSVSPLIPSEITNNLGEAHLESNMALFRWRLAGKERDMDNQKVDYTYRYGNAEIDIQLKSRNLDLEYKNWQWVIFPSDKELDKKFYAAPHTFLFLVGIKLVFEGSRFHQEVIQDKFPQIALIPGNEVVRYFAEKSLNSGVITLSLTKLLERKDPYWNDYFGEKNIYKTLIDTWKQQEEEAKFLEQKRSQK
jgi:hypothetical protein